MIVNIRQWFEHVNLRENVVLIPKQSTTVMDILRFKKFVLRSRLAEFYRYENLSHRHELIPNFEVISNQDENSYRIISDHDTTILLDR